MTEGEDVKGYKERERERDGLREEGGQHEEALRERKKRKRKQSVSQFRNTQENTIYEATLL
jgi:hypothetical protein